MVFRKYEASNKPSDNNNKDKDTTFQFVGLIFTVVGLIFFSIGSVLLYKDIKFNQSAQQTTGIVVDLMQKTCSRDNKTNNSYSNRRWYECWAPHVSFTTNKSQQYRFTDSKYQAPAAYQRGESVMVLYQPDNPQKAKVKNAGAYMMPGFFARFGALFLIIGVAFLIHSLFNRN